MPTLYLKWRLTRTLPRGCCVVQVSALLKELILYASNLGTLDKTIRWQGHLIHVIVNQNQLEAIRLVPLQLPNPSDPRALRVAKSILDDPEQPTDARRPMQSGGHEPTDGRETISGRHRNDVQ